MASGDIFGDPFKNDAFSSSFKKGVFDDPFGQTAKPLGEDTDRLLELAKANGYDKEEDTALNAVQKFGRVLNWDIARISGMVLGAVRDDMSVAEGYNYGVKHNTGFQDVYQELYGKPQTTTQKIAMGTAGFVSDVLFSPLTYLSFGTAGLAKAGAKITKPASKVFNSIESAIKSSDNIFSHAESLAKEGMGVVEAKRLAEYEAKNRLNSITQKILTEEKRNGKISQGTLDKLLSYGVQSNTAEELLQLGGHLLDKGGIKMFGRTLISSEAIANSPVGKSAKALGETRIAQAIKDTVGDMFVYGFGKNPKLLEIASRTTTVGRRATNALIDEMDEIFRGIKEEDGIKFTDEVLKNREAEFAREQAVRDEWINVLKQEYPTLASKASSQEDFAKLFNNLEEDVLADIKSLRETSEKLARPEFKARQAKIKETGVIEPNDEFNSIDRLNMKINTVRAKISAEASQRAKATVLKDADVGVEALTATEKAAARRSVINAEEERLMSELDRMSSQLEGMRANRTGGGTATVPPKVSVEDQIALIERQIQDLATGLGRKEEILTKILNARKISRAESKDIKLKFKEPKLQKMADRLINDKDSFTVRLAKIAGIPESEAYKFYIRPYYQDILNVKKAVGGRNVSPFGSLKQDYLKVWTPEASKVRGDIIKKPAELYKRAGLEVVNARIKSDGIKSVFKAFAVQAEGKSASQMEKLGFVKYEKKILNEKLSGWIPKAIKEDINEFVEPSKSKLAELARITGFDWATNMMKSWVTSIFPAFHILNVTSNQFQLMVKLGMDYNSWDQHMNTTKLAFAKVFPKDGLIRKTLGIGGKEWEDKFMKQTFKDKKGKTWTNAEFLHLVEKNSDLLDQGMYGDIERGLTNIGNATSWNPASLNFKVLHGGRELGNFGEIQAKLMAIQSGIVNGKPIKAAIKDAEDAIFNYGKLTPFEKEYMRRLVPFYTFARKNAEFQIKSLASTPGRVASQFKFFSNVSDSYGGDMTTEEESGLPNFVLNKIGIKTGVSQSGNQQFMTGFGLPIEEFLTRFSGEKGFIWNTMSNIMTQSNPILKYPTERVTGVDLFRGKPIEEITNAEVFDSMVDNLGGKDGWFAKLIDYRVVKKPKYENGVVVGTYDQPIADPIKLHLFRNLPSARLQSTIDRRRDEAPNEQALRSLLGIDMFTFDAEREKFFKDLRKREDAIKFLELIGIGNTKEIFYIPKDK